MATAPMDAHAPTRQPTESSFPQELPPRKFTQTWMQKNGFKAKTFFTLHYHSFSFRKRHGALEVLRRIAMWLIMIGRFAQLVLLLVWHAYDLNVRSPASDRVGYTVGVLVAVALLMVNFWTLALIGDAAGTRKALGIAVRRKGLDAFLIVMAPVELVLAGTSFFWLWGPVLPLVWVGLWLLYLGVGLMASGEAVDQYGTGV